MDAERHSLVGDLTDSVRSASLGPIGGALSPELEEIEAEHQALCVRRRQLHKSIDMLAGVDVTGRDASALLERFRRSERVVSLRRAELYARIRELREWQLAESERL